MAELVLKNKQYLFPKETVRGSKVHHPDLDAVRISLDLKETVFSGGQRVEVKWRSTSELSQSQEGTLELQRLVCVALRHSASILQTLTWHHKPMVSKQIYASEKSPSRALTTFLLSRAWDLSQCPSWCFSPHFSILPFTQLLKDKQKGEKKSRNIHQLLFLWHSTHYSKT